MANNMYYTIYKITNKISGKIYIGAHKTRNLDDGYMGSGTYLIHSLRKHGLDNFEKEILFVFESAELMYAKEAELVNEDFLAEANTYNLKVGGFGSWSFVNQNKLNLYGKNGYIGHGGDNLVNGWFRTPTHEEREKISNTLKQGYETGRLTPPFLGKTHTDETKTIIGNNSSFYQKGEGNSQYGTRWIYNPLTKENKKIKGIPAEGWHFGKYKAPKIQVANEQSVLKKSIQDKSRKEQQVIYSDYYEIYKQYGWSKFVEITGYSKSQQNLVSRLSKWVVNFEPQNGKKR
jgi:hypothetical protein